MSFRRIELRPNLRAGEGGLDRDSWVKGDQVTTIGKGKAVYPPLGALDAAAMGKIAQAIGLALDLLQGLP